MGGFGDGGGGWAGEPLLGAEEVAGHFGVKKATVYRWCKEGRIPCMKIGKHWRVRREVLEGFPKKAGGADPSGRRPSEKTPSPTSGG